MVCDLKAVLFAAGKGSRITELSLSTPKCLLPVGNEPIIYYSLKMLEKAKFKEVLIVIPDVHEDVIQKALSNKFQLEIEFFAIPFNKDIGTADTLRLLEHKIDKDVLLVSCDVVTDFDVYNLINMYRIHNPTLTVLVSTTQTVSEGSVPGRKGKGKLERDLIGIETGSNRLLFLNSESDFEEEVSFHKAMLRKCPQFEVRTDYLDTHIYIMKKWVLSYLKDKPQITSVKGELIPALIKKQFMKEYKSKETLQSLAQSSVDVNPLISDYYETEEINKALKILDPRSKEDKNDSSNYKVDCFAYLMKDNFCVRSNSLLGYLEANKQIPKLLFENAWLTQQSTPVSPSTVVGDKAQIGNDCIVADGAVFGDRVAIKRSVVGRNCNIKEKVKLVNCIVMDNVNIDENCSIQGTIICSGVHVGHSAEVKDCIIGAKQQILALGKFANEVIVDVDHMMEL